MRIVKFHQTQKFLLFCFYFSFLNANGQKTIDSTKMIYYDEQFMLRLNLNTNLEDFVAENRAGQKKIFTRLTINNRVRSSLSVDYKLISASLSFAPDFLPGNNDERLKGKSSYSELKFRFFPEHFIQTLYYRNVKGFYVDNMEDFLPEWQRGVDPFLQFPDLRIRTYGGSTSYVFNQDFSLKSIYLTNGTKSNKETDRYLTAKLGSGIHLGYNSSKFIFGGKLDYITEYYRQHSTSDVFNNNFYRLLYFGYRFPPPKTVKDNYDKMKNKIPVL